MILSYLFRALAVVVVLVFVINVVFNVFPSVTDVLGFLFVFRIVVALSKHRSADYSTQREHPSTRESAGYGRVVQHGFRDADHEENAQPTSIAVDSNRRYV
jgi:hypothetical protein